jgi:hypothetical protein
MEPENCEGEMMDPGVFSVENFLTEDQLELLLAELQTTTLQPV